MITELGEIIISKGQWLALLMLIDVVMGVLLALRSKTFNWTKFSDFLITYGLRIIGWLAAETISLMPDIITNLGELAPLIGGGVYFIVLSFPISSILGHLKELGIVPDVMKKLGV